MSRTDVSLPLYAYMTSAGFWDTSTIPEGALLSYICQFPKEFTGLCVGLFVRVCTCFSVYLSDHSVSFDQAVKFSRGCILAVDEYKDPHQREHVHVVRYVYLSKVFSPLKDPVPHTSTCTFIWVNLLFFMNIRTFSNVMPRKFSRTITALK